MLPVSDAYKNTINAHTQQWKSKIIIDYTDYNLDNSIVAFGNDNDRLSQPQQMADGIELPSYKYWSWGNFEWGQHLRDPNATNYEQGALSERVSNKDSEFDIYTSTLFGSHAFFGTHNVYSEFKDYPRFSLQFSPRTVQALKIVFDGLLEEWGVDFDVNVYVGGTIDTTEVVTGNTTYRWTKTLSSPVLLATQIEVVVKKWSHPNSKVKIMESFTSIQEVYETDEIISLSIHEESEPEKATSPTGNITSNQCNFQLINIDSKFDNTNTASVLAGNVIENRRVRPFFVHVTSGQEIQLGTFYTRAWKIQNTKLLAEGACQDIVSLMDKQEYTKSQWITPGSDTDYTYTTTADFNTFTLENVDVGTNEIMIGMSAVICNDTTSKLFGTHLFPGYLYSGNQYCGTALKQISFTYTPGTTVNVTVELDKTVATGGDIKLYIDNVEIFENIAYKYTPAEINDTSQQFDLLILLSSQSIGGGTSIQEIRVNISETVSPYSLARLVIDDFDTNTGLIGDNFVIDQAYGEIEIPSAYILPQTHKSAMKLIAESIAGRVFSNRDGVLEVKALQTIGTSVKTYTSENIYETIQPVNDKKLYNRVIVYINPLTQNATPEQIASLKISLLDTETNTFTVEFTRQPADTITLAYDPSLPGGVTLDSSVYYVWGAEFTFTNASGSFQEFTLNVSGKVYEVLGKRKITLDETDSIRKNGIIVYEIDNPLIQTVEQAQQVAEIMVESFGVAPREIIIDSVPDPAIEIGDTVTIKNNRYITTRQDLKMQNGELAHIQGGKN